jgi:hypothetical protein
VLFVQLYGVCAMLEGSKPEFMKSGKICSHYNTK